MASLVTFEAIGTHWSITIDDALPPKVECALFERIHKRIALFDKQYSRFREDSLVTVMSKKAGNYTLPEDAKSMMSLYRELYLITGGLLTPLVGKLISDAGYDASYSLQTKEMTKPDEWDVALSYTHPVLMVHTPTLLDFGAAGKGYLVDIVSALITEAGCTSFCVNAGGDIFVKSESGAGVPVALEHPDNSAEAIGVATISNQSICGSSGNRRAWGEFHHIINPKSLLSPKHIRAVWVVADSCMVADALATALFFVEPQALKPQFEFEYLIVWADYSAEYSTHFPGKLFS
jgi:thiamine biosynthesis lipoprotein